MGPLGHLSAGIAAKRFAPGAPLVILLAASWLLDLFAVIFPTMGGAFSHGLFMAVVWSVSSALLWYLILRSPRAGIVIGMVIFSHWVLDLISHPIPYSSFSFSTWRWDYGKPLPSDLPLLFRGSPVVGLGLYNHISAVQATVLEAAMFLGGSAVYANYLIREKKKQKSSLAESGAHSAQ